MCLNVKLKEEKTKERLLIFEDELSEAMCAQLF